MYLLLCTSVSYVDTEKNIKNKIKYKIHHTNSVNAIVVLRGREGSFQVQLLSDIFKIFFLRYASLTRFIHVFALSLRQSNFSPRKIKSNAKTCFLIII